MAPGRRSDTITGRWERDLEADLRRLREFYRIDRIVSLLEPREYRVLGIAGYPFRASDHGFDFLRFPIRDGSIPEDRAAFVALVDELIGQLRDGRRILVHCKSGLGRSGTLVCCLLVRGGWVHGDQVVEYLRGRRRNVVETPAQREFVESFPRSDAGSAGE